MDLWLWHWQISWVQCLELRQAEQGSSEYLHFRLRLEEAHLVGAVACLLFRELLECSEEFRWHLQRKLRLKVEPQDEVEEEFLRHCLFRLRPCSHCRQSFHRELEDLGDLLRFPEVAQDNIFLRCPVHSLWHCPLKIRLRRSMIDG